MQAGSPSALECLSRSSACNALSDRWVKAVDISLAEGWRCHGSQLADDYGSELLRSPGA